MPEKLVYSSATDLSLIFLFIFICFNKARRGVFSFHGSLVVAHTLPTCLVAFLLYRLLNPMETRKRWLMMLWNVLAGTFFLYLKKMSLNAFHISSLPPSHFFSSHVPHLFPRWIHRRFAHISSPGAYSTVLLPRLLDHVSTGLGI